MFVLLQERDTDPHDEIVVQPVQMEVLADPHEVPFIHIICKSKVYGK
jgi:hypothetical protein